MLTYYGVDVTQKDLDDIEKNTGRIQRLLPVHEDVVVNITPCKLKNSGIDGVTAKVSCAYRGYRVIGEGMGSEKRIAVHLACDDAIRKIRKIKTKLNNVVSLQERVFPMPNAPVSGCVDAKSNHHVAVFGAPGAMKSRALLRNRNLSVEKMSTEAAIDQLQGEGLTFFVYLNDEDTVCFVTRNANGGFTNFEVC